MLRSFLLMHIVWLAYRFQPQARVRTLDNRRVRDHSLDLLSEARAACESPLQGFPYHTAGWGSLQRVLGEAGVSVHSLDADPLLPGKVVAFALVGPGELYTGPVQELDAEADFVIHFSGLSY